LVPVRSGPPGRFKRTLALSTHERRAQAVAIVDGLQLQNAVVADVEEVAERKDLRRASNQRNRDFCVRLTPGVTTLVAVALGVDRSLS